jgi:hypothetical protein
MHHSKHFIEHRRESVALTRHVVIFRELLEVKCLHSELTGDLVTLHEVCSLECA